MKPEVAIQRCNLRRIELEMMIETRKLREGWTWELDAKKRRVLVEPTFRGLPVARVKAEGTIMYDDMLGWAQSQLARIDAALAGDLKAIRWSMKPS